VLAKQFSSRGTVSFGAIQIEISKSKQDPRVQDTPVDDDEEGPDDIVCELREVENILTACKSSVWFLQ